MFSTLLYYDFINLLLRTNYSSFIWWCPRNIKSTHYIFFYNLFLSTSACMTWVFTFFTKFLISGYSVLSGKVTVLIFINFLCIYYINWGIHMFSFSISLWSSKFKVWTKICILFKITLPLIGWIHPIHCFYLFTSQRLFVLGS